MFQENSSREKETKIVDLFCGCGGLSLGFELYEDHPFRVVLGLDIDGAALRCFNDNHPHVNGLFSTARNCDLTWFSHPAEVLLYYLVHYADWAPDPELEASLRSGEFAVHEFLAALKREDQNYNDQVAEITASDEYLADFRVVDPKIFSIGICKAFFTRMGIRLPRGNSAWKANNQLWQEEYQRLSIPEAKFNPSDLPPYVSAITKQIQHLWQTEAEKLNQASQKKGRGQNASVAPRLRTFMAFLGTSTGQRLRDIWKQWRAKRDALRALYCNTHAQGLRQLYTSDRRVHLLLGGPPCKGFSRAGRPVVRRLFRAGHIILGKL